MAIIDTKFFEIIGRLESKIDELQSTVDLMRRRQSTYIGNGAALTYLFDDSPFYVNSYDFGPPSNYLNGGKYEQDNLDIILSFIRPESIFLDIGANLGFFSLIVGRRVRPEGKVYAFEPNKNISKLFKASAYLNSLSNFDGTNGTIIIHEIALGKSNENGQFLIPDNHAGGARITSNNTATGNYFSNQIVTLDSLMPENFKCDVVKIDVEGYELNVLTGMEKIIKNSENIKIVFENYWQKPDNIKDLINFLKRHNLFLYSINPGAKLKCLPIENLYTYHGYLLASKIDLDLTMDRFKHFTIFPKQFWGSNHVLNQDTLVSKGSRNTLLLHGPYWFLESGYYEIYIDGLIEGNVELTVCSNFGYVVSSEIVSGYNPFIKTLIPKDLIYFEVAMRVMSEHAEINITSIKFTKLD